MNFQDGCITYAGVRRRLHALVGTQPDWWSSKFYPPPELFTFG